MSSSASDASPAAGAVSDVGRPRGIGTVNLDEEMRSSYLDYAMSVIVGRALPDARDGLKPVHRRVLYAMHELGNTHNRPFKKSARVVGDVLGKYHPHGEQAAYDALVRMAQDFALRYPLVEGQGNFGSLDGDPPAAMRYTEVRLNRLAEDMLADIDRDTVDFVPNYNNEFREPTILPSRLPNLLLNGSTGIAVGMATNIPPHNLGETVEALIYLIENPGATVDDLMRFIKGPDFPTGGVICGVEGIAALYRTGRGQMVVRGRAHIDETESGRDVILITEIPYTVNKAALVASIAELVNNKTIEGVSDVRDESSKEGVRIVVDIKRGTPPTLVLNALYKHTQLETTFGGILLALDHGVPRTMNLKDLAECFIRHRLDVVTRRTRYELHQAEARAHILEGFKMALDQLEAVVKAIRSARNREEACAELMRRFNLTEVQAHAILDMRLYQLTNLERQKIDAEYLTLIKEISRLRDLMANERKRLTLIQEELRDIRGKYQDARRTDIAPAEGDIRVEDLIADRGCVITISHRGYIKRVPVDAYRAQRRGGKGVSGMATREEDFVEHLFVAHTHDYILFFTAQGRVYWKKVYEIPEAGRASSGKAIVNLLNVQSGESIAALIRVRSFVASQFLLMATARGRVKKTNLAEYGNPRSGGIIGIHIEEKDRLVAVKLTSGNDEVILTTRQGMSIRFSEKRVRDQGRATYGVRGIRLAEQDTVESMEIVNTQATLLSCTENGYGKRTRFDEYPLRNRGGKGVIAIRTSERNGCVVGAHAVMETDTLMLITAKGKMIRLPVSEIRVIGRATQGVRLIDLDEGDKVVCATTVQPEDDSVPLPPSD